MIAKKITLKNFQQFTKLETYFANMTFIKGKNGVGKTTLGLDAILFVLFGYARKSLSDLPTRDKAKTCTVEIELEYKGHVYNIERKYPTHLEIFIDGIQKEFKTNAEAQRFLSNLFGDVNTFKRFRMVDNEVGINFLEEGQQTLKKILFSVSDTIFNSVRENLNKIKRNREVYNKEKAVIYPHHPSEARLDVLDRHVTEISNKLHTTESADRKMASGQLSQNNTKGQAEGQLKTAKWQRDKIETNKNCFACKQEILPETKKRMAEEKEKEIADLQKKIKDANDVLEEIGEIRDQNQPIIKTMKEHCDRIKKGIMKLEGRIKQKDYIYTSKDIEIVKMALKELDRLSTRYLTQSLGILEPIINSVLEKIMFTVHFEVNDKGKMNITLTKEGVKYNYKDLSAGQRLLLQIAFKLALLLERNEEGLIIADEGLSSLDSENLTHVLTIFENFPFQLIFIIHNWDAVPGEVKTIDLSKLKEEK